MPANWFAEGKAELEEKMPAGAGAREKKFLLQRGRTVERD